MQQPRGPEARLVPAATDSRLRALPLGMELLATVDWLLHERECEATVPEIRASLGVWPGGAAVAARKQRLFDDRMLGLALERLV